MTPEQQFLINHWEQKSNAILGFVVIQSILLADKLADDKFVIQIKTVRYLIDYLFVAHSFIVLTSVILLILIDSKISKKLGNNNTLKKDVELHITLVVKLSLAVMFGLIPIFIFAKNIFNT